MELRSAALQLDSYQLSYKGSPRNEELQQNHIYSLISFPCIKNETKAANLNITTVVSCFCIFFFLAGQQGLQDLSSLTRDQTQGFCSGSIKS